MYRSFPRLTGTVPGLLALLAALSAPGASRADTDLSREMAKVAAQIKLLLDERGQSAIAVGDFRGPAKNASSAGPALTRALTDELTKCAVGVKRRAELEVNGEYRDVEDEKTKFVAVQIKAHVVDRTGNEVVAFEPRGILNVATVASLIGVTVALPAGATDEERDRQFSKAIDEPRVHLAGARTSASADSPYAVEILVKSGNKYRPRSASQDEDGFAFLKINRDEVYAVRLINDSPLEAAVALTVDGLSVFAFSDIPGYTHWVVAPKSTLTVPGWHRTNQVSDSFRVTEYAKSAAAERLPSPSPLGTITAGFSAAWPRGTPPPGDEASRAKGGRSGDATGKGPPVSTDFAEVVREIGRLRASVSVRYNKGSGPVP